MAHPALQPRPLLEARSLSAGYLKREVLLGVSLRVEPGEIVAVLGHNGAGKTTLLKAIFGSVPLRSGHIEFNGADVTARTPADKVRLGISFTPAETPVFRDMSVRDNVELGAFTVTESKLKEARMRQVLDMFPVLEQRAKQFAGSLSGGEQRMLTLAIALMSGPKLMLLDEPSLGLAPALVERVLDETKKLAQRERVAVLVVEQNVRAALRVASRAYFMRHGRVILEEPAGQALARGKWWDLF